MSTSYRTILSGGIFTGEYEEKKSRFIANLTGVSDEACAREFINGIKKKYYDARHNVSAYILRATEKGPELSHSSDDGEPPGTAGRPVLDVISGAELKDVVMVVTRYFGGTLLGTGGLVRAYSSAAKAALSAASVVEMRPAVSCRIRFAYPQEGAVRRLLDLSGITFKGTEYTDRVEFNVYVPEEKVGGFEESLKNQLSGRSEFEAGAVEFLPFEVV